jgi:hypothetical protein
MEKVATAVLSTTAKAKARERTKEKEKAATSGDAMDTVSLFLPPLSVLIVQSLRTTPQG